MSFPTLEEVVRLLEQHSKDLLKELHEEIREKFELEDIAEEDLFVEGVGEEEEEEEEDGKIQEMEAVKDAEENKEGIQQAGQAENSKYVDGKVDLTQVPKRKENLQERVLDGKDSSHVGATQKFKVQVPKQDVKDGVQYFSRMKRDYKRRKIYKCG